MTSTRLDAVEARAAAAGGVGKRAYVRRMFSEIAPRYDLLNHLLSLNIDRGWRRAALARLDWEREPGGTYLDLCAGTLDVGAALAHAPGFHGFVVGADFAEPMLRGGLEKAPATALRPVAADALLLPLPDNAVSGAIVAFGVRNVRAIGVLSSVGPIGSIIGPAAGRRPGWRRSHACTRGCRNTSSSLRAR